jgi:hypothetical protein
MTVLIAASIKMPDRNWWMIIQFTEISGKYLEEKVCELFQTNTVN